MGADTFIRVGSCGAVQPDLGPGDVIHFDRRSAPGRHWQPPTCRRTIRRCQRFEVTRALVDAAAALGVPVHIGIGASADAFLRAHEGRDEMAKVHVLSVEMESDTLFVVRAVSAAGAPAHSCLRRHHTEVKPVRGEQAFRRGEENAIQIALRAMHQIAVPDHSEVRIEKL